jgi:hypothetical protein
MNAKQKKSIELYMLCFWMAFLSLNGLGGGVVFMIEPDGSLMGMTTEWLTKTPFHSFLIPGICLFLLNGVFPLIALTGLIGRKENKFFNMLNVFPDKHWSWTFSVYSGIITITWIIIQQLITNFFVLQPIITAVGLINMILALMPRVQKWYTKS